MNQQLNIQTGDAMQLDLPVAGVGGRSYAFIIDWHIRILFVMVWFIGIPLVFGQLLKLDQFFRDVFDGSWWFIFFVMGPPAIVYFLYHPALEILMKGRTPGKRMAGIRIVTTEGYTPGVGAVLIRNIFRLVDSLPSGYLLGLVVAMATKNAVRIGDIAAGTVLIYEDRVEKNIVQNLAGIGSQTKVDPRQWEVVTELLSRWQSLERSKRIRLAQTLFKNLGEDLPEIHGEQELDADLKTRLEQIIKG